MPAINFNSTLLRLIKDVNDIRSALRRVTVNLPLFDISNENAPAQLTADQNNYVPGNYDLLKLSSNQAGRTITGIRSGIKGRFLRLFNVGSFEIILSHQDTASNPENRIISPTGFDIILNAGGEIVLYYDTNQNRWISSYSSNADRISVELQLNAAQSIADATYQQISWENEVTDTGDFFDSFNPTYVTIPETGWHQVSMHVAWLANDNGMRVSHAERSIASPYGGIVSDSRNAVVGGSTNVEIARLFYFSIGERVYATVWQNSGAPLDIVVQGGRESFTRFSITKM